MKQKKKVILWCVWIAAIMVVMFFMQLNVRSDDMTRDKLYIIPFGKNGADQQLFFWGLMLLLPYLAIFLGFGLSYGIVWLYMRYTKFSKRIEFVGFSKIINADLMSKRRYLIQMIFGLLLCMNIWIYLLGSGFFDFWVAEEYKSWMYTEDGAMLNFPMVPWYWVPMFITTFVFAACSAITDSGLVTVKKLPEHKEFSDTERVGDKIFTIVKGYAGISVIIGFIGILQTPLGKELSLVVYPINVLYFLFPVILAIDILKDFGRRVVFKAVKTQYEPQLIALSSEKKPITNRKEIYE